MINKNDNRERKNKYPKSQKQDTKYARKEDIRNEMTKKDLHK